MQGMMSFVRVLSPDQYDQVMARIKKGVPPAHDMPGMKMNDMPEMKHSK
jgi:hypothetical protein